jgi:membrane peptidoglycan carboxypeptidase
MQPVTLRDAMVHSLNVVTVDVAMDVTIGRVMNLAAKAGLPRGAYPAKDFGTR